MSSIPSINPAFGANRPEIVGRIGPHEHTHAHHAPKADSVEFSAEALSHTADLPADQARTLRLAAIKAQIDAGTYNTDDKLSIVADKIARSLAE